MPTRIQILTYCLGAMMTGTCQGQQPHRPARFHKHKPPGVQYLDALARFVRPLEEVECARTKANQRCYRFEYNSKMNPAYIHVSDQEISEAKVRFPKLVLQGETYQLGWYMSHRIGMAVGKVQGHTILIHPVDYESYLIQETIARESGWTVSFEGKPDRVPKTQAEIEAFNVALQAAPDIEVRGDWPEPPLLPEKYRPYMETWKKGWIDAFRYACRQTPRIPSPPQPFKAYREVWNKGWIWGFNQGTIESYAALEQTSRSREEKR